MGDKPYGGHPPFVASSDTSEAAADSVKTDAARMRAKVRRYIKGCGAHGATCWEVEMGLDMLHQTASARICELKERGSVVENGKQRRTGQGRMAQVLVAANTGQVIEPGDRLSAREQIRQLRHRIEELEIENGRLKMRVVAQQRRRP